ncbi:MAG: DnaJ domain-containing protein, partial [Clostridiales bacterium]|nr:DnaJ domain-containing protein [Clostridiales bacterium]
MMNIYEQLGIEQTASQQEIKRAYFRLVREFTPEKYPKEFMQIRQAYETLSDSAQRTAYDATLARFTGISKEVTAVIIEAERLGEKGLWADAVDLLEQSQYSANCHMQSALCSLYLELGKSGKAVKIAEKLAADHPDNADYLRLKAKTYMERGWTNKADEIRRSLERLDPGNEDNTSALLFDETKQNPLHLGRMVERVEEKNGKAPLLCAHILSNCFNAEKNSVDYIRQQLLFNLMGGEKQPWSDPLLAAKKLAEHSYGISADKGEKVRTLLEDNILKAIFFEDCYSILPDI